MGKAYSHIVPKVITPERLQEYGVGLFSAIPTKSALKKALKKEQIQVNGVIASTATMIKGGETIAFIPSVEIVGKKKFDFKLNVLFEDDYLAAVEKPPGMLVSGNSFRTLANALPQNLMKSMLVDATRPQPVHRLDFATTGIVLVGKTSDSIRKLHKLFEDKNIRKTYYAVTMGLMESSGTIETLIEDKEAITLFEKIESMESPRFEFLNLVKLQPRTGRRHQIRIHLAGIGNPILGDRDYSPKHLILKGKGMYLHAFSLEFVHPFTEETLSLKTSPPERFTKLFARPWGS